MKIRHVLAEELKHPTDEQWRDFVDDKSRVRYREGEARKIVNGPFKEQEWLLVFDILPIMRKYRVAFYVAGVNDRGYVHVKSTRRFFDVVDMTTKDLESLQKKLQKAIDEISDNMQADVQGKEYDSPEQFLSALARYYDMHILDVIDVLERYEL